MRQDLIGEYQAIWDKYSNTESFLFKTIIERDFLFQFDDIQNPDIVFVGINPSYNQRVDNRKTYGIDSLVTPYFKPFKDIRDSLSSKLSKEIGWTHLDLLVFRETNQSVITNDLFKNPDGRLFLKEQLAVSKSLLENYHPKVIVVSNALARGLFKKETGISEFNDFGFTFEFCNELGTDKIQEGCLTGTPVFFTSMLSGQRAIDIGARQRLVWHIGKVLSNS